MVKSNEQLGLPTQEAVDSIDLQTPGLTAEQDERIDTLVDSGFNYTEARQIAGVGTKETPKTSETAQPIAETALANNVQKPKTPYSWQRSRKGYSAAELRIADGPPEHIAREIRGK